MSKIEIDKDLVVRLRNAALNGSVVAETIMGVLKNPNASVENDLNGKKNFFRSKRRISGDGDCRTRTIAITCCAKDLTNENFKDKDIQNAMWLPGNRTEISVTAFAKLFTAVCAKNFEQIDFEYLDNIIAIDGKLTCHLGGKFKDFYTAYDAALYSHIKDGNSSSLHNSCMRYEHESACAADFYANFAGNKIIYCQDENGYVYGRALFWPNVTIPNISKEQTFKVLDRVYVCFKFVENIIKAFAKANGADFFKTENTYSSQTKLTDTRTGEQVVKKAYFELKFSKIDNYKGGAPYVDTFCNLIIKGGIPYLANYSTGSYSDSTFLHNLQHTGGTQNVSASVCPICGNSVVKSGAKLTLCPDCASKHTVPTPFGPQFRTGLRPWFGELYPNACFDKKGNPTRALVLMSIIDKFGIGKH